MGKFILIIFSIGFFYLSFNVANATNSSRPTFHKDIQPILQNNCVTCHRPSGLNLGGIVAPMSLITYKEVRPWSKSIAKSIQSHEMPPWHSEGNDGIFSNERRLSAFEIATIGKWVAIGSPKGNVEDSPGSIEWPETEWSIGTPDLIISMNEPYMVLDSVEDQYRNFNVDIPIKDLPQARWIKAIEFKAGSSAVHHIIAYSHGKNKAGDVTSGMIGGIAPGNDPDNFPDGYGTRLASRAVVTFAMHYHKEAGPGTGVLDQSSIGFKFYPENRTDIKKITIEAIGNNDFDIPANNEDWEVGMSKTFERETTMLYYMPHMHLRGKSARYVAFYPNGESEELLSVPNYDFNWQTSYALKTPKIMPAGTRIEVTMHFDNSPENGDKNGFDSNRDVKFGGPTTDEMALGWISYTEEPVL